MTLQLFAVPKPAAPQHRYLLGRIRIPRQNTTPYPCEGLGTRRGFTPTPGRVKGFITSLNRLSFLSPLHPFTCS